MNIHCHVSKMQNENQERHLLTFKANLTKMFAEMIIDVTSDFLQVRDETRVCFHFCQTVKSIVSTQILFQSTTAIRHACPYHLSNNNTGYSFTIVQVTTQLHQLKRKPERVCIKCNETDSCPSDNS